MLDARGVPGQRKAGVGEAVASVSAAAVTPTA